MNRSASITSRTRPNRRPTRDPAARASPWTCEGAAGLARVNAWWKRLGRQYAIAHAQFEAVADITGHWWPGKAWLGSAGAGEGDGSPERRSKRELVSPHVRSNVSTVRDLSVLKRPGHHGAKALEKRAARLLC
jgi:hypothetical protein